MMFAINSSSSSNLLKKSKLICWRTSFCSGVTFFGTNFAQTFFIFNSFSKIFLLVSSSTFRVSAIIQMLIRQSMRAISLILVTIYGVETELVIFNTLSALRNPFTPLENTCARWRILTMGIFQQRIALNGNFFYLTRNFTLIRCFCFSSHIVICTRKKNFISNIYRKSTTTTT